MSKELDRKINSLKSEIQVLEENPDYAKYTELQKILEKGEYIRGVILRKLGTMKMLINQSKEEQYDPEPEEEEPEDDGRVEVPQRRIVAKPKREEYKQPTKEREQQLDKKVKKSFEPIKEDDDNIPGLPDELAELDDLEDSDGESRETR